MKINVTNKFATELYRYDSDLVLENGFFDIEEWGDYAFPTATKLFFRVYANINSEYPLVRGYDAFSKEFAPKGYVGFPYIAAEEIEKALNKQGFVVAYKHDISDIGKEASRGYIIAFGINDKIMLTISDRVVHYLHTEKESNVADKMKALHTDLAELITKLPNKKENTRATVYGLGVSQGSLQLQQLNVKIIPEPNKKQTALSYPSLQEEKIAAFFDDEKSKGKLLLFSGEPGTGKTTYIRQLIGRVDPNKKVILSGPELFANLEKPEFSTFVMRNFVDAYLIIEDAERFLVSRENGNNPISLLLNYTDGLFGDAVNLKVIATFNTDIKNIDKALLRAGRLHFHQHFDTHTAEQAYSFLKQFDSLNEKQIVEFVESQIAKDKSFSLCNLYEFLNEQREKENV